MTTATPAEVVKKAKAATSAAVKRAAALQAGLAAMAPPAPAAPAPKTHTFVVPNDGKTDSYHLTRKVLSPSVNAGLMFLTLTHKGYDLDLGDVSSYLKEAAATAASGDLVPLQQMLAVQARSLDQIFYDFARRAANCTSLDTREQCLKVALKAQSQCRTTVESIAVIQQGPAIFAKNANINNGQQQVNNGVPAPASTSPKAAPAKDLRPIDPPKQASSVLAVSGFGSSTRERVPARGKKLDAADQTIGGRRA